MALAVLAVFAVGATFVALNGSGAPDEELAVDVPAVEDDGDDEVADPEDFRDFMAVGGPQDGRESKRHPIEVSPNEGLVDGQVVTVTGSNFPANEALGIVMCSGNVDMGGGIAQCVIYPYDPIQSDAEGNFITEYPVRRIIYIGGHEIDCAAPPPEDLQASCVIAVGAISDYDESGIAPIYFDDGVAPPPPPTVTVSQTEGLVEGQTITITVDGVNPETTWWPMVCAMTDGGYEVCHEPLYGYWPEYGDPLYGPDTPVELPRGSTSVEITVVRVTIWAQPDEQIDCAEPERCYVRVNLPYRSPEPIFLTFVE